MIEQRTPFRLSSLEQRRCGPAAFWEWVDRKTTSVIESTAGIRATDN